MKESLNNLLTRRAVRKYKSDMVPQDVLDRILKAGTYAPSGMGKQSAIIIAITDRNVRDKLAKINAKVAGKDKDPFYGAPVVIVVLADSSIPTYVEDGALVLGNLLNAAHAEGFGSCWVHRAKQEFETPFGQELLSSLGIEGKYVGIGHCILGYADVDPAPAPRKENYIYKI